MSLGHVAVVGGGLAGLRAALTAADRGCEVTLLERRRHLGGLTWSFERGGRWFDNGQHVFLRCCTEYLALLERLGVTADVHLQPSLDLPVIAPGGARAAITRSNLPAPLHLAGAVARYRHLRPLDRARLVPATLALRALDPEDPALDDRSFGDWLAAHGQSRRAVELLWDLIARPTLNVPAARASLAMAVKVFRTGLLDSRSGGDLGWAEIPLRHLHGEAGARALTDAGVALSLGCTVERIDRAGRGFRLATGDRTVDADAVVVATPPPVTAALVPAAAGLPDLARLGSSPVVDVHLVLDRKVTDLPVAAVVGSPVQFVFDRTAASTSRPPRTSARSPGQIPARTSPQAVAAAGAQYLALSLSAADQHLGRRADELIRTFAEALGGIFPKARQANLVDAVVTRERAATFAAVPGSGRWRPAERTAVAGLAVAGAWCATGWPATMEGAVRSGAAAARHAVAALGGSVPGGADAPRPGAAEAPRPGGGTMEGARPTGPAPRPRAAEEVRT